jgi:hypothetical protein
MILASCRAQNGAVAGVIQSCAMLRHSPVTAGEPSPGFFLIVDFHPNARPRAPRGAPCSLSLSSLLRDSRELSANLLCSRHNCRHRPPEIAPKNKSRKAASSREFSGSFREFLQGARFMPPP